MNQQVSGAMRLIEAFIALMMGKRVPIRWRPGSASINTSGEINLPPPVTGDAAEVALLTRLAVHESGHLKHTETGWTERLQAQAVPIFNALEDPRMEASQARIYPGAGVVLARGLDELLPSIMEALPAKLADPMAAVQLNLLLKGFLAHAPNPATRRHVPGLLAAIAPALTAIQHDVCDEAVRQLGDAKCSRDAEAIAATVIERLRELPPPPPSTEPQSQEDQKSEPDNGQSQEAGAKAEAEEHANESQQGGQDNEPDGANSADGEEDGKPGDQQPGGAASETDNAEGGEGSGDAAQGNPGDAPQQGEQPEGASDSASCDSTGTEPDGGASVGGSSSASQPGAGATADVDGAQAPMAQQAGSQAAESSEGATDLEAENSSDGIDLGTLLREVLVQKYGQAESSEAPAEPLSDPDMQRLHAVLLGANDGDSVEELLEQALVSLHTNDAGEGPPGAGAGMALAPQANSALAAHNSRLQGVQSRLVTVLRRELQDKRRRPVRAVPAGGRVNPRRLWRLRKLGDPRVFVRTDAAAGIEAAATVLVDSSLSMDQRLHVAVDAALAFSLALQRLGVRTKVARFPGTQVVTETLQAFGENPRSCSNRCAGLIAGGGTPLGTACLVELPLLLRQKRMKNLLVILTDGQPGDPEQLAKALQLARDEDVTVVGVGIGCVIEHCIPTSVAIQSADQLPDALTELFRSHLATVLAA
ncbi:VWA domain-containing protein [Caenimonas sedimenti]|nr:VWA domain-containing protein [Caenimonas sedimenti]